ncbi:putative MFS multidrug transporter [Choiromyces venosus 120613-1]|uniref:Putative MFS multidrug transporter n=1 Tax=Choiromyces venosus 120613-1 TaxID=1336337 RepID=A0A3N4JDW4_9PEZI|nr:putative MFS multidrug transporter [Choiromyces venosus 120613-1]
MAGENDVLEGGKVESVVEAEGVGERKYITGWRLHVLTFGIALSLFLSTLETTIVSTSLISITNALNGFDQGSWVVTSYMLTYTGFLIIYAKFSDIFGRKPMVLVALLIFTVLSIVCGASQNMLQLHVHVSHIFVDKADRSSIVFRAFQGLGGSGIYAMSMVITPDMIPPEKFGLYMGIISSVFALSSVLGPVLGGVINDRTTWRWVFLLNAPAGSGALALVALILPSNFPHPKLPKRRGFGKVFSKSAFRRLDWRGTGLSLAASVLLVYALQQAGTDFNWNSAKVITTLAISVICWIGFVLWERVIEKHAGGIQEPIFPWRVAKNRAAAGVFLSAFFTGFPFLGAIINLPQRFQIVNGTSATGAGIRLFPMVLTAPLASWFSAVLISVVKIPAFYVLVTACSLQVVGLSLMGTLPTDTMAVSNAQYGYEVIMGMGFGLAITTAIIMVRIVVDAKDQAVVMGAITQIRVLGGTVGLAISATLLSNRVKTRLPEFLNPQELAGLLRSSQALKTFDPEIRDRVRLVYAEAYNQQMILLTGFAAASLLSLGLSFEKKARNLDMAKL